MFASLIKRYIGLYSAKALHTTTAAVGRNIHQMVLGIGIIVVGLILLLLTLIVLLGSAFLYISELQYSGSLLVIGIALGVVSIISLVMGSAKLKRA